MRIALIYPEVYDLARFRERRKEFPPFGPLYLGAVAERAGHRVEILKVSPRRTRLDLRRFDAVGYSVSASAAYGVILKARRESQHAPDALLMAGGIHANFYPREVLAELDVDVVGFGDGEHTILELLDRAETKAFAGVPGICFKEADGRIVENSGVPVAKGSSIDHLPLPARHLLPAEDLIMEDRLAGTDVRMAHVMFSRGCPYRCRFCAVANTPMQYRSGASARAELEHLIRVYRIGGFAVVDDNFIIRRDAVIDICQEIEDLGMKWSALSRVNMLKPELLGTLRQAGCIELKLGMESGSPRILKAMQKSIRPDQIRSAVYDARDAGIGVKLFVIHGYPGENLESSRETLALLKELAPCVDRVSLFRFVPLPGTYVYEHPEEFDLHGTDKDATWSGDWSSYHIHHNTQHWWGSDADFRELEAGYLELRGFIERTWPDPHAARLSRTRTGA
jgi:anaerobic magnesium-protoporphyrin IX monomethyl ester cyclase